jgi:hypothetical protein
VGPFGPIKLRSTVPYPCIHICVLPAQMQSAAVGGRRFQTRLRSFVMCIVEPKSRIKECLSG